MDPRAQLEHYVDRQSGLFITEHRGNAEWQPAVPERLPLIDHRLYLTSEKGLYSFLELDATLFNAQLQSGVQGEFRGSEEVETPEGTATLFPTLLLRNEQRVERHPPESNPFKRHIYEPSYSFRQNILVTAVPDENYLRELKLGQLPHGANERMALQSVIATYKERQNPL